MARSFLALLVNLSMRLNTCYFQAVRIVVEGKWDVSYRLKDQHALSARSGRSLTSKPTVVVTAGQFGQVFIGIQLAKSLSAGIGI